jgi:ubiquinone/menaquinone biosynthesis C-methylase UbiE
MLLVDAYGRVSDLNAAVRVLMGTDVAGCRGQAHEFLTGRLGAQLEGDLFLAEGVTRAHTPVREDASRPMYGDVPIAEGRCRYQSAAFGRADLATIELPCIDTVTGELVGSVLNIDVLEMEREASYRGALRARWAHDLMWEIYASSYDAIIPEIPFYKEVLDRHLAALRGPGIGRVLDIGAGTGTVTVPLVSNGKSVTAVEIRPAMLAKLLGKLGDGQHRSLTIVEDTAECLPQLAAASFDGVTVLNAFFDMTDPHAAFAEAVRVLRPGGVLVITDPKSCFDAEPLKAYVEQDFITRRLLDSLSFRDHWRRVLSVTPVVAETIARKSSAAPGGVTPSSGPWSAETIYERLRQLGFVDLSLEDAYLGHFATITGKKPS